MLIYHDHIIDLVPFYPDLVLITSNTQMLFYLNINKILPISDCNPSKKIRIITWVDDNHFGFVKKDL